MTLNSMTATPEPTLVVVDRTGVERARGTGTQESLLACAFVDEGRVVAVGRDVNRGPAILELAIG